jgi:hypothetical protein
MLNSLMLQTTVQTISISWGRAANYTTGSQYHEVTAVRNCLWYSVNPRNDSVVLLPNLTEGSH